MKSELIQSVIEKINTSIEDKGEFIISGDNKIRIDKNKFKKIDDRPNTGKVVFLDGGNSELIKSPSFCLQFIRIYYSIYEKNKRVKNNKEEFYCLISAKQDGDELKYDTDVFGTEMKFGSFNSFDASLKNGNHKADIARVGDAIRRLSELKTCIGLIDELREGDIIVIDGALEPGYTGENKILDELFMKSAGKNIAVCGLSKTSTMNTDSGNSALAVLHGLTDLEEWNYPLDKIGEISVNIIKLNKSSGYAFRLDMLDQGNLQKVLSVLRDNSKDYVFPGYPYGMIEADRFARVANSESEYLKMMFITKSGYSFKSMKQCMSSIDAHGILDNIS